MGDDVVRLLGISAAPLDVAAVYDVVLAPAVGAVALFVGVVRDHDDGLAVVGLSYSAHPTADSVLRDVVDQVLADSPDTPVESVAAVHRVGDLAIGDVAVIVAVACGHRREAFSLCARLVDEIKSRVPIWKHQVFADGSEQWVGTPE